MSDVLIRAEGLHVRFGERQALDGLSFHVAAGEVLGLLGPNGAGKTTTLSVLATLRRPDAGTATVGGYSTVTQSAQVRQLLGVVPQALAIYPTLTASENVSFFARLLGLHGARERDAVENVLAIVGLSERRNEIVATFSGGMQRRLNLACGLLHRPRVVLLDEPTVGVDPQSRERIFAAIRAQAADGAAAVYSTHYLEEAERLCDRVLLIDHGRMLATGTPAGLIRDAKSAVRLELTTRTTLPAGWHADVAGVTGIGELTAETPSSVRGTSIQVRVDTLAAASRVLERAAALGGEVLEFHLHQPGLADVFFGLTGRALRD